MKAVLFLNPNCGAFAKASSLTEYCSKRNEVRVVESSSRDQLPELVERAVADGANLIVAGGGDGTVHAMVNAMRDHFGRVTLGIIPLGTGNDFARSLAIPLDPVKALELVLDESSPKALIDLIEVTAEAKQALCVNMASGGLGGEIEKAVDRDTKERWGPLTYVRGAVAALSQVTEYELQLVFDGHEHETLTALNVIVANARTAGGGFRLAPHADVQDRLLDIVIVKQAGSLASALVATRLLVGDYTKSDDVSFYRASTIDICSTPAMDFSVDGNLFAKTPIRFKVLPRMVAVIAGPEYWRAQQGESRYGDKEAG